MSLKVTEEGASGRIRDGTLLSVSPPMVDVLSIRGIDTSIGEKMAIASNPRLTKVGDPFRTDQIRRAAMDVLSIMVEEDMRLLRELYKISDDIGLMMPEPNEQACFLRRECTALHLHTFVGGLRLHMHPFEKRFYARMTWHRRTLLQMDGVRWSGVYTCDLGIHLVKKCLCMYSRPCTSRGNYRRRKARKRNSTGIISVPRRLINL
ncbi:hypothetical protein Adt_31766 [Abeliophyllum distichum]|uniref:Uncharacterized protein n=1 Tax=Abeliophyllum distichum TaxID=126358 RepID=A0ABD1RF42_9LAMI